MTVVSGTKHGEGAVDKNLGGDTSEVETELIEDVTQKKTYLKGKMIGKGAHARVYLATDTKHPQGRQYAIKVMLLESTSLDQDGRIVITKGRGKEVRLTQAMKEVDIHNLMSHPNIVRLESHFQRHDRFYMVLEYCKMHTLAQMLRNQERLQEPDCRGLVKQLIDGLEHIHSQGIIHRDLKPANIYLTSTGQLKIGDFGLADKINSGRRGICGTPNYISPEVLMEQGYTTAVDIWAVGCMMYHMLAGKPPFEADNQNATYELIRSHRYTNIPSSQAGAGVRHLINCMLSFQPRDRPNIATIRTHAWMKMDGETEWLHSHKKRKPCEIKVEERNSQNDNTIQQVSEPVHIQQTSNNNSMSRTTSLSFWKSILERAKPQRKIKEAVLTKDEKLEVWRSKLGADRRKVHKRAVLAVLRGTSILQEDKDLGRLPVFIAKWIDYSNKYGFGYQLTDGSIGVLFNNSSQVHLDGPRICVTSSTEGVRSAYPLHSSPSKVKRQLRLLNYFNEYMDNNLASGVSDDAHAPETQLATMLCQWMRTDAAAMFELDNGVLQVNFFSDHNKFILYTEGKQVSVIVISQERTLRKFFITRKQAGLQQKIESPNVYQHLVYLNYIL